MSHQIFVSGAPAAQGSKKFVGVRKGRAVLVEQSKNVGPWRKAVADAAQLNADGLLEGPVALTLEFVMPRPKSTPRRSTPPAVKRPDLDKLARAICDALTGIWFADDSRITHLAATKRLAEIGEKPGVHITATVAAPTIRERTSR